MQQKPYLALENVRKILDASAQFANEKNWKVTIAVVDDGGHLLGLLRLDGASPLSATIAPGKARAAALGRCESANFENAINGGRQALLSVPMDTMLEGGVPIVFDGQVIGAVGVSGVKSNEDAEIARAGIATIASV